MGKLRFKVVTLLSAVAMIEIIQATKFLQYRRKLLHNSGQLLHLLRKRSNFVQRASFVFFNSFEVGRCKTGYFFKLAAEVSRAAIT